MVYSAFGSDIYIKGWLPPKEVNETNTLLYRLGMMVTYFIVQDVERTSNNFSNEDILKNDHNKKEAKKVEYTEKIPETTSKTLNVLEKIARREGITVDLPTPDKLTVSTTGAWFKILALRS